MEIVEGEASDHVRSPVDVLRLLTAGGLFVGLLVLNWLFGDTLVSFAGDLFRGLEALPHWIIQGVVTGARVLAVGLLLVGAVSVVRTGSWAPVVPVGVAAASAAVLTAIIGSLADSSTTTAPLGNAVAPRFPTNPGLAATTAAVTAAAPWLARGWRRASWAAVIGLATARFLATPASLDTLAALLIGWLAGAAAVVAFGGPWRRPRGTAVARGLKDVGIDLSKLEQASLDARGSTPYFAQDTIGDKLFVKVLGDDERSADRLFRLYRRIVPHDLGDERAFSSLRRAVEHEALVALVARDSGVRTPRLAALARAEPNGFVLAYEAVDGQSLDRVEPADMTDELLLAVWVQVTILRRHHIAHRDLRLANVFLDADNRVWLIDFGFSELAASDTLLATDVAELVASSALLVGAERSVAAAATAVGRPELVAATTSRLQRWALSGATRHGLDDSPGLLDDLHREIAAL